MELSLTYAFTLVIDEFLGDSDDEPEEGLITGASESAKIIKFNRET